MGLGGVNASQRLGPLELVTQVAVEVGHPARVQVHHCDVPIVGPARKTAAQHEGWEETQRQTVNSQRGGDEEWDPHSGSRFVLRRRWSGGIFVTPEDAETAILALFLGPEVPALPPARDHRFGVKNEFPHVI